MRKELKRVLLIFICLFSLNFANADETVINLYPTDETDTPIHPGRPKAPIPPLTIYMNNGYIYFDALHPEYEFILLKNDMEVFAATIEENELSINVPSFILGDCEIKLLCSGVIFVGTIFL